ncbi:MAG: substrate-binding domain-containing protein [Victivallaceae bacterium]|nr:substrate-binding domain-containing protein [Victivallaceae bacterium]
MSSALPQIAALLNNDSNLAGIICTHPDVNSFDLIKRCKNVPLVIYNRKGSMLSNGGSDIGRIGELAAAEFCRLRVKKAAFLMFDERNTNDSVQIIQAIQEYPALTRAGIAFEIAIQPRETLSEKAIAPVMEHLFDSGVRALLLQNTYLAERVLQWAYRRRMRIPEELSLFCVDFEGFAGFLSPPVSAITFPLEEIAKYTVESLMAKIEHRSIPEKRFSPYWLDRGSTLPCGK